MASMEITTPFRTFDQNISYNSTKHKHIQIEAHTLRIETHIPTSLKAEPNFETLCSENGKSTNTNNNVYLYAPLLEACTNIKQLHQVHAHMLASGRDQNIKLRNKLLTMYAACGSMDNARLLFDKTYRPNVFLWTAMISGYVRNGLYQNALMLYDQMQLVGIQADKFTFTSLIKACAALPALQDAVQIHDDIVRSGFESDICVGNALVAMYCKFGRIKVARQVFDKMSKKNVISWSAMLAGYAQSGFANEAMKLFIQMQLQGIKPDPVTIASLLPPCAHLSALQQGKQIHCYIIRSGFESDVIVVTALIDMYAKCQNIDVSRQLFDKMSHRDVVSWSAIIAGYAQNGYANEAFTLFHKMQLQNMKPDSFTMTSILLVCAHLSVLQQGKCMHSYIIKSGFESDVVVGTALIDMYAKCGSIHIARQFFDKMSHRNTVSWSAMIAGYGMHGHGEEALRLFTKMQEMNMMPDHITFIGVLSACSHSGLVDKGWQYFDCMSQDYCITPKLEHYACMVDLLGRAGRLDEAHDFIKKMPLQPNAVVWGSLLSACRIHRNIKLGEYIVERLFHLEPENAGQYVLLSNIYAAAGRWVDVEKVRRMIKDKGMKKIPGCSWIEVNNRVHLFFMGDRSHPQSDKIYSKLAILAGQMKEAGYAPETNYVLHDVEEEVKEHMLYSHSEKLAVAFGLINTSPGTSIRIMKNLRVCGDCHSAMKFISNVVRQEIIVRDANRFHHFKDGLCSCGDYW
eukprot:Gb_16546 [translate_table: standard]